MLFELLTTGDDVILDLDQPKLRRRVLDLTHEILGERERKVFLACCIADARQVHQIDALAAELGITRERVYRLEASAKRKIITALTHDGLLGGDASRSG